MHAEGRHKLSDCSQSWARAQAAQGGHKPGHTGYQNDAAEGEGEDHKLQRVKDLEWYARVDSNHRPFAPEANAKWL